MTQVTTAKAPRPTQDGAPRFRAVIYLRVSTAKQAGRAEDPEGYSLPAQREACERKAEQLGAEIVGTYVDKGESAKTAERPEFQRMLAHIRENQDVDYVILDKIDRFARNRRDDANLMFELKACGAQLVSVKENIDETPAGELLHAIMAGIAEFYSRNLGTEAVKGMTQKAKSGGTPGRAPLGYINVPKRIDGREIRSVEPDPERAPLIKWAFEQYATGQWTLITLTDALAEKGLTTLASANRESRPIYRSRMAGILNNRYYAGFVFFRGIEYQGRHEPLISEELFNKVQGVLRLHDVGERQRTHHHYLKGTLFCEACGGRLCLTNAKGKYLYFFCVGSRQGCVQRYVLASQLEHKVAQLYQALRLGEDDLLAIQEDFKEELEKRRAKSGPSITRAKRQISELELQRRRVARGVVDGSIPSDLAKEEQERIARELSDCQRTIATADLGFEAYEKPFQMVMQILDDCEQIYVRGDGPVRRMMNQLFFDRVLVRQGEVAAWELKDPWYTIRRHRTPSSSGRREDITELVTVSPTARDGAKGSNNEHLAAGRVSHSNLRKNSAHSSKKAVQAPPTGFEPVLPP